MRGIAVAVMCVALATAATAADLTEGDVLLKSQIENYGARQGLSPVVYDGVTAMAFEPDATAAGGVKFEQAGDYTLLVRCYAPAGDQDGFYVEIGTVRTRRTAPIGNWGTLAYPFTVDKPGALAIVIIGQEPGMTVDAIAVVRGTHKDNDPKLADVPGEMAVGLEVGVDELDQLVVPCSLAAIPDAPFEADGNTVYHQSFDAECPGAVGDHHQVEGKWGQALNLDFPDGRFDVDASALDLGEQGTIEWWVRPRPAQELWWDQGWHYFLHCKAADGESLQLDLSSHPLTQLRLIASSSEDPYYINNEPGTREWVQRSTSKLDGEAWHHILVSWDLTGEREYLWLMIDGVGRQSFFPGAHDSAGFSSIELCNTPSDWDVPFLPVDGAIDELRIQNISVADRLAE